MQITLHIIAYTTCNKLYFQSLDVFEFYGLIGQVSKSTCDGLSNTQMSNKKVKKEDERFNHLK